MSKHKYVYETGDSDETTSTRSAEDGPIAVDGVSNVVGLAGQGRHMVARGVRLGLDVGLARVGVASSDPEGLLATPVATVARSGAVLSVVKHIAALDARVIIIGLPRTLKGSESSSAAMAKEFGLQLHQFLSQQGVFVPIRVIDERFTTVSAHSALSASGRKHKTHRSVVDQVAAVMILQHALDMERNTGRPAGDPLVEQES